MRHAIALPRVLPSVAAALVTAGCVVYDPALLERADAGRDATAPRDDAGADAGDPIDAAPPDDAAPDAAELDAGPTCDPRHPPAGPAAAAGDVELVFAFRDVVVDQRMSRWEMIGYDLDDLCTSVDDPTGACAPPSGEAPPVDGARGVDNAFGKEIFSLAVAYDADLEANARQSMHDGDASMLLVIRGWNGEDDDGRVDVHLAQATRGEGSTPGTPPVWDGTDRWWLAETDFVDRDPTMPVVRDDVAYVADRHVVMRIPDGREIVFPWTGNNMHIELTAGFLIGRISDDGTRLEDLVVTGRWSLVEIGAALTAAGVCPGDVTRVFADSALRRNADVRSDPRTDGMGADCDALSVAIGFTGVHATIAGLEAVPAEPPMCPMP